MPATKRAGEELESSVVKKKVPASSRTGQACDRCKIRKIRCDARPGGCSPCLQNNTECKTTDRITGRATTRGAIEQLENENSALKMYMLELQHQLRDAGVEPKTAPSVSPVYGAGHSFWADEEPAPPQASWGNLTAGNAIIHTDARNERKGSQGALLPDFRSGCIGDNYLGVSSGNNWLSNIEGTSLALFGMKIDVAEFLPPESDPMATSMSYPTFLSHALGKTQPARPPKFPPYEEFKMYADWFFKTVQVFIPILHRPDFMALLRKVFFEQHQPSTAETVMLHMVVAIMKFQTHARNRIEQFSTESTAHYLYAVSLIPDLVTGHTLSDIQALVLICSQLRNQPRPGAAWMFTNAVFGIVVEIGLHRSANNWQGPASERDSHTIEMRKRIFWSILLLLVSISGKLGRPMPIRLEDFDIEIPEARPDHMPEETHLLEWHKCSFRAALQGYKACKILMQAYSTVYSIRSGPEPYDVCVRNIDKQLNDFLEKLPPELSGGPQTADEDRGAALYLQFYINHVRLVLHHPSLCRSSSPRWLANNLDVCMDAANKLLSIAVQLKDIKALDTTWMQTTDFLAAIFTTLFIHAQRQEQMSSSGLQQLRQEMDSWLEVMEETGNVLGAGSRLRDAVKQIVDASLSNMNRNLAAKTASAGLGSASASDSPAEDSPEPEEPYANGLSNHYNGNDTSQANLSTIPQQSFAITNGTVDHQPAYTSAGQLYSDPHATIPSYTSESIASYVRPGYDPGDMKPNIQALNGSHPVMPPQASQPNGPMLQSFYPAFPTPPHENGYSVQHQPLDMLHSGPTAWRHFTDSMITNMGAQDYMSSGSIVQSQPQPQPQQQQGSQPPPQQQHQHAHAHPQHQHQHHSVDLSGAAGGVNNLAAMQMAGGQHAWPLLQYTSGQ